MVLYTQRQVIEHIHRFLVTQLNSTGATYWTCVLRKGRLRLIAPCSVRAADLVLADSAESLDRVPLRTVIYEGVNKHWDALSTANIKIQEASLQAQ